MRRALLCSCLLLSPLSAQDVKVENDLTRWRFTFEQFDDDLTGDDVGLLGVHYDLLEISDRFPQLYAGVGGFSALTGERGGLLFGGVNVGWLQDVQRNWDVDIGLFAGGGGGGGGQEFDGLVLRPHAAIERSMGLYALRLELAHLELPDADQSDTHIAFGVSLASESLRGREIAIRPPYVPDRALIERRLRITPQVMHLAADPDSLRKTGQPLDNQIQLLGVEVDYFFHPQFYVPIEAYGSIGGRIDGFSLAMTGLGMSWNVWPDRLRIEAKAVAGGGGGGNVEVGGGLVWHGSAGIRAHLVNDIWLSLMAGQLSFPDGELETSTVTAGLSWSGRAAELDLSYPRSRLRREHLSGEDVEIRDFRVRLLNKLYRPPSDARKKNGSSYSGTINLLGVGFEKRVSRNVFLTARMFSAYTGDLGGYAEGLLGLKYELPFGTTGIHDFHASIEGGAAGGAGADVGSGLVFHGSLGYSYRINERLALNFEFGRLEASKGTFEAESALVGLTWSLDQVFFK